MKNNEVRILKIKFSLFLYIENQQIILNSYASCRRLLDHSKQIIGIHQDGKSHSSKQEIFYLFLLIEIIDLMDNEGKVKELNAHFDDYASQFLTARSTYYVLKVESKYLIER
jgi:hypothetical protein